MAMDHPQNIYLARIMTFNDQLLTAKTDVRPTTTRHTHTPHTTSAVKQWNTLTCIAFLYFSL
jgi:hypothetical protein